MGHFISGMYISDYTAEEIEKAIANASVLPNCLAPVVPLRCPSCGAPLKTGTCEYCGTTLVQEGQPSIMLNVDGQAIARSMYGIYAPGSGGNGAR